MRSFLTVPLLVTIMTSCGPGTTDDPPPSPGQVSTPPPTVDTPVPVVHASADMLLGKRWTTPNGENTLAIDLENKFGYPGEYMYHLRLCKGESCDSMDLLFFAVGDWKIINDELCFATITYWDVPPKDFFVQSPEPFCIQNAIDKDDKLNAVIKGTPMVFTSQPLHF